jgi:hypothetical protein
MLDLYGKGCVRLVKLLRLGGVDVGLLKRYHEWSLDQAIRAVSKELGLVD